MNNELASINEVIGFLNLVDPKRLNDLRETYPAYSELLKPGGMLGEDKTNPNEALVRGVACKAGLERVLLVCKEKLPQLKRKLKSLGNIQFGSQVVVGIGGASLFLQFGNTLPSVQILTGVLTLAGSLLSLFVQHKSGTILNNNQSIFSYYEKLVDYNLEAEQQLLEIDLALQAFRDDNPDRLIAVINTTNQICLEIRKLIEKS
ncbi:MAG: hypothetical protein H6574_22895 [Lewinellaceae bacterium]|nr:hypothetical protein [Lewinellaceae bacterium]